MKKYLILVVPCVLMALSIATSASEKSVKHFDVAEVLTMEEAKRVFQTTTAEMKTKTKTKLEAADLNDIHIITYSLEKAVAYFTEHLNGESQKITKNMAEVVESVHIASENGRKADTKNHLEAYFELAATLSAILAVKH